jgi:hypothetical protein
VLEVSSFPFGHSTKAYFTKFPKRSNSPNEVHPNLEIHNLRKININKGFFFVLGKRVSDFRVSMKNLLI